MICSVLDYLERAYSSTPDKLAFSDINKEVTYRDFRNHACTIASILIQKGLDEKQPVIVCFDKNVNSLEACFGVVYAGGIYCPFDINAPIERLNKLLEVINPRFLVTDNIWYEKAVLLSIDKDKIIVLDTEGRNSVISDEIKKRINRTVDTDPLYIICTSGSTGTPKGVVIPHRAVIDFVEESSEKMEFSSNEVFANEAPFYFDASVPDIFCTIRNSASMYIIPRDWFRFPIRVLEYIREKKVSALFWVPSALIAVANLRALGEVDISCVKKVMFCGEVMPAKQLNMWIKALPKAMFVNYYGPTETTYASTYYIVNRKFRDDEVLPIGKPAKNTRVYVLDENNKEIVDGSIGELYIGGSGIALGYYNNNNKTEESFIVLPINNRYPEKVYKTGDLVHYNEFGELEYDGRKDSQIKLNGYRIELGEIEMAAMSINGVNRGAAVFNKHKNEIILCYEGGLTEGTLESHLRDLLPVYMLPKVILLRDGLPMNANNKVDRVKLQEEYGT